MSLISNFIIHFKYNYFLILFLFSVAMLSNQTFSQVMESKVVHPAWSFNKSIYEVNLRQYTKSGTFSAFEKHLPQIKKLGVGIIWFMPITPIGVEKRKGKLGSYYSVRDYFSVNPEFGTMKEFIDLVKKIHQMNMYVILDWVADHTSWDNPLTIEHPDWYKKNSKGNFILPEKGWTDVIALNYSKPALRKYMINAMKYWVEESNIDGFRCDVADKLPTSFWNEARKQLDKIKPVFMLAEAENPKLQVNAFDMTYSWKFYSLMNSIAKGKKNAADVIKYFQWENSTYPANDFRMRFTTNHDENSWDGTVFERLGNAAATFAALTVAVPGMPLLYSGQEAGLNKRLDFFDRDPIVWRKSGFRSLYTKLFHLKSKNIALWNGKKGGGIHWVSTLKDKDVLSFIRKKDKDKIFFIFNLSNKQVTKYLHSGEMKGKYLDLFSGKEVSLKDSEQFKLKPWEYKFYIAN